MRDGRREEVEMEMEMDGRRRRRRRSRRKRRRRRRRERITGIVSACVLQQAERDGGTERGRCRQTAGASRE
jgi:hypothetical protein